MKNHKGEIATFLTLSLVVVGTVLTIATSILTNTKKNIASNPRAAVAENGTSTSTRTSTSTITPQQEAYNCSEHGGGTAYQGIGCYDLCEEKGLSYIPNSQGKGSNGQNYCCCKKTEASQGFDTCYKAYRMGMYGCDKDKNKVVIYARSMKAVGMKNCSAYNKDSTTALYFAQNPGAYKDGGCYAVWDDTMDLNKKNQQAERLLSPTPEPGTEGGRCISEYIGYRVNSSPVNYYCFDDYVCSNQTGDGICVKPSPTSPSGATRTPTPRPGTKGGNCLYSYEEGANGKQMVYFCNGNLICSNQTGNGICVKPSPTPTGTPTSEPSSISPSGVTGASTVTGGVSSTLDGGNITPLMTEYDCPVGSKHQKYFEAGGKYYSDANDTTPENNYNNICGVTPVVSDKCTNQECASPNMGIWYSYKCATVLQTVSSGKQECPKYDFYKGKNCRGFKSYDLNFDNIQTKFCSADYTSLNSKRDFTVTYTINVNHALDIKTDTGSAPTADFTIFNNYEMIIYSESYIVGKDSYPKNKTINLKSGANLLKWSFSYPALDDTYKIFNGTANIINGKANILVDIN